MNADPRELEKFSALAHRWWDPGSEFRPLHQINPLRLDWIDGLAPLGGKSALDIGCGGGILAEAMAKRGARVTGIDLSEKALKVAQLHLLESKIAVAYEAISAEDLAARSPGAYDVVTCMELLEHVPDPASTVRACAELARHCRDSGLAVREIKGMTYNPLTRTYALGADTDVNYLVHCTREA